MPSIIYTKGSVDLSFLGSELERILSFSSVFPSLVCSWICHLRQGWVSRTVPSFVREPIW
ncbi:unnamed protein product, partial [Musa hybrid cultivar]